MKWFSLNKQTLQSRTFWTGVATIITPFIPAAGVPKLIGILAGLAMIFMRDAVSKSNQPPDPLAGIN